MVGSNLLLLLLSSAAVFGSVIEDDFLTDCTDDCDAVAGTSSIACGRQFFCNASHVTTRRDVKKGCAITSCAAGTLYFSVTPEVSNFYLMCKHGMWTYGDSNFGKKPRVTCANRLGCRSCPVITRTTECPPEGAPCHSDDLSLTTHNMTGCAVFRCPDDKQLYAIDANRNWWEADYADCVHNFRWRLDSLRDWDRPFAITCGKKKVVSTTAAPSTTKKPAKIISTTPIPAKTEGESGSGLAGGKDSEKGEGTCDCKCDQASNVVYSKGQPTGGMKKESLAEVKEEAKHQKAEELLKDPEVKKKLADPDVLKQLLADPNVLALLLGKEKNALAEDGDIEVEVKQDEEEEKEKKEEARRA